MQYFGIPTCPYCRKRVNLIRTWKLKREGEYKCPRCGGISNVYLSPLVYVFCRDRDLRRRMHLLLP